MLRSGRYDGCLTLLAFYRRNTKSAEKQVRLGLRIWMLILLWTSELLYLVRKLSYLDMLSRDGRMEINMKLGIMQPYFLPYIGYWQLLNAVDKYIIYDDVNYINRGWVNRNRILQDEKIIYFNVPLLKASQNKLISEIEVNHDTKIKIKNLRTVELAYKKAPYFKDVFPLITEITENTEMYLSQYLAESIKIICDYLGITTELILSSSIKKDIELKGEDKILEICRLLHATEYYNAVGGQELYSYEHFEKQNMQLKFIKTNSIEYSQFKGEFQPNLSILDVMMFNSVEEIQRMLSEYTIITESSKLER